MYYDMHCHLDQLDDISAVVERAENAGLGLIVVNGLNEQTNQLALQLESQFPIVKAALGIYPNDAVGMTEEDISRILETIRDAKPFAIGEVGVDLHHDKDHLQEMTSVFERVLQLAQEIDRPVIIHSRKAEREVIDLLERFPDVRACLHCFGGSLKLAKRAASMGVYFSVPPVIVRATHFQRLVEEVPLSQILTETDSPWMSPDNAPNEPKNVTVTCSVIAEVLKLPEEEVSSRLWQNARNFFSF